MRFRIKPVFINLQRTPNDNVPFFKGCRFMQTSSLQLDDRYSSEHSPSWSGTRVCLTKPGSSVNVVQKSHSLKLFYFFFRVNTKTEDVKFKVDRQNKDMSRILGKK